MILTKEELKRIREEQGMTRTQMAKRLGFSATSTYTPKETGVEAIPEKWLTKYHMFRKYTEVG